MIKKILLILPFVLLCGCAQKAETKYFLPSLNTAGNGGAEVSSDTVSYLSGDKIWYKKDGLFLPYKNSYFAKTVGEFVSGELAKSMEQGRVFVKINDAYQLYNTDSNSSFVLSVTLEYTTVSGKTQRKTLNIEQKGFGIGAKEATHGLEACVQKVVEDVKNEFREHK